MRVAHKRNAKAMQHSKLWDLATLCLAHVDPAFVEQFTDMALTKNFIGSPTPCHWAITERRNQKNIVGVSVEASCAWTKAPTTSWRSTLGDELQKWTEDLCTGSMGTKASAIPLFFTELRAR